MRLCRRLSRKYKNQTGHDVALTFGSSGNLTTQIRNGAPFDVFFSADEEYPKQLIAEGLADPNDLYRYAVGRLVLWVPNDSPLDLEKLGMRALLDTTIKKIAIANPQHAPYGRAAEAALRHDGIYDQIAAELVLGENVSQAAQFVESGNAQAGLIALSHALAPAMKVERTLLAGSAWLLSHAEPGGGCAFTLEAAGSGAQVSGVRSLARSHFPARELRFQLSTGEALT